VKWFLALLVLLGGGLAAAAFAVPTNAAVVNGSAISQQQLNSDVTAIAGSPDYQCYLNSQTAIATNGQQSEPPVVGAGKGQGGQTATATTAFTASYLDTEVGHELVEQLARDRGIEVSEAQLAEAKSTYENEISQVMQQAAQSQNPRYTCGALQPLTGAQVLATLPASFVDSQVQFFASVAALKEDLAGVKPTEEDLHAYFVEHRADFDTICTTAALYSSVNDANAALQQAQTTPFSEVAKQAQQGGVQPCAPLPELAAGLPSSFKLGDLAVGTVSFPVALGNGEYLLIQVNSRTPTSFEQAKNVVPVVVQNKGTTKAQRAIQVAERHATVSVDPRYGVWLPVSTQVLVPFTPEPSDVPNVGANTALAFSGPTSG
jgi:parvulin-like peptidyl-prolyl cis-trans isomerase-like protein